MAVSPDGLSVYGTGGGVWQYDVGTLGRLSPKSPAMVAAGGNPFGLAVSPDGRSVYVANGNTYPTQGTGSVFQYDVGARGGLSPKSPPRVAAGDNTSGVAVGPLPRVPTDKAQCRHGGWRNFGSMFKNQGQCIAFVQHQARAACQAQRSRIGRAAFRARYGQGRWHLHAMRRCVQLRS